MTETANTFRKHQRVLNSRQFGQIMRKGTCVADGVLVLCAMASKIGQPSRLGVTIPKKAGSAVVRNRWKRLIRESFRTQQQQLPSGYDFVVRPKKGAQPCWDEIQSSVPRLAKRATKRRGGPDAG